MPNDNDKSAVKSQGLANTIKIPSREQLDQLAELDDLAYDAIRKDAAKSIGVRVVTLDTLIKEQQQRKAEGGSGGRADLRDNWRTKLIRNSNGAPAARLENALLALRRAPVWRTSWALMNSLVITLIRPAPWERGDKEWKPRPWTDIDDAKTTAWLERAGIPVSIATVRQAVQVVAREAPVHPIRSFLQSLEWDRVPRVEMFASRYLGAADTPYHRSVSKRALIAAVARVMKPGCKVDNVPVLEGPQGSGKSRAVRALFDPWFTDDLSAMDTKDAKMEMNGVWGVEIAALTSMTRSKIEAVKAFISRQVDRFRPPYGRHVLRAPRQVVLWATTNRYDWQEDDTGGRRFWPIKCGRIALEAISRERDQLWAEAFHLFKRNEQWWLTAEEEEAAKAAQDERRIEHPWEPIIAQYLDGLRDTSIQEVLSDALDIPPEERDQAKQKRVARILQVLGWRRYRVSGPEPRPYRYRRVRDRET
jgi:predicted P-loop ATPase